VRLILDSWTVPVCAVFSVSPDRVPELPWFQFEQMIEWIHRDPPEAMTRGSGG
jgi:hypothetical protein